MRPKQRFLFQDDRLPYLAHHHGHHVGVDLGGIVALKPIECSENLGITLPLLPHLLDQKADHFNRRGGGILDLAAEVLLRHRTRTSWSPSRWRSIRCSIRSFTSSAVKRLLPCTLMKTDCEGPLGAAPPPVCVDAPFTEEPWHPAVGALFSFKTG